MNAMRTQEEYLKLWALLQSRRTVKDFLWEDYQRDFLQETFRKDVLGAFEDTTPNATGLGSQAGQLAALDAAAEGFHRSKRSSHSDRALASVTAISDLMEKESRRQIAAGEYGLPWTPTLTDSPGPRSLAATRTPCRLAVRKLWPSSLSAPAWSASGHTRKMSEEVSFRLWGASAIRQNTSTTAPTRTPFATLRGTSIGSVRPATTAGMGPMTRTMAPAPPQSFLSRP